MERYKTNIQFDLIWIVINLINHQIANNNNKLFVGLAIVWAVFLIVDIISAIFYQKHIRGFERVSDEHKKTETISKLPTRATKSSMAYDFYANGTYNVEPNQIVKVWTDIKAYMREDECLVLNVRSSMGGKFMLANTQGWIDSDYYNNKDNEGNIGIFLKNISDKPIMIMEGDRIAQGTFFKYLESDNGNTDRNRKGGFGSTN